MRTRHHIPSIFSLSMVDVLCCALGCVLLLWLLNVREARDRTAAASEAEEQLADTRQQLSSARKELSSLQRNLAAAAQELDSARSQIVGFRRSTADLSDELDRSKQLAAANRERYQSAEERAAKISAKLEMTQAERDAAGMAIVGLEKKLTLAGQRTEELTDRISDADARLKLLQALADQLPGLRGELKDSREKLASEQALAQGLEKTVQQRVKELADLRKVIDELRATRQALEQGLTERDRELAKAGQDLRVVQGERKMLLSEVDRAKAAAENRFAGINLTGRRVVFLIDKSGSMGLLDEKTEVKDKWPAVAQTVARIMRSLPDLEKFQVVVFSSDASYLLGQDGRWLDYDSKTSADRVVQALAATEPVGGTNLYAALETAFRLRSQGMDTIYLLSDGIPDRGAGLPPSADKLPAVERADILSKHVRRTLREGWNRALVGQARVRINCVGFFYESPDVGAFLWALARENDGSFVGMSKP